MEFGAKLFINEKEGHILGYGRVELLKSIQEFGSLSKAAKACGMSYKGAWDALKKMQEVLQKPLIESKTGGRGGGGSTLTPLAKELIEEYEFVEDIYKKVSSLVNTSSKEELLELHRMLHFNFKTKNKIVATLTKVKAKDEGYIVTGSFDGYEIKAKLSPRSFYALDLQTGDELYFLFNDYLCDSKEVNRYYAPIIKSSGKCYLVQLGSFELNICGKVKQKGGIVEFGIHPKSIIVFKKDTV